MGEVQREKEMRRKSAMEVSEITNHTVGSEHSAGYGERRWAAEDCVIREEELSRSGSKGGMEQSWVRLDLFLPLNRPGIQYTGFHCKLCRMSDLPTKPQLYV
jgi:hypothetical protein